MTVIDPAPGTASGPSLSDALGAGPVMPDGSKSSSGGAFDTLNGNILSR